jgi:flagellar protein FliS
MSFGRPNGSNAYQQVAAHGGVSAADPHKLILMLLDGAIQRIAQARGCTANGAKVDATLHLQRALAIVGELRASLDALYDYIGRQLLIAHVPAKRDNLAHLSALLGEIRSAWAAIPPAAQQAAAGAQQVNQSAPQGALGETASNRALTGRL